MTFLQKKMNLKTKLEENEIRIVEFPGQKDKYLTNI